jgi:hypothetical protein
VLEDKECGKRRSGRKRRIVRMYNKGVLEEKECKQEKDCKQEMECWKTRSVGREEV